MYLLTGKTTQTILYTHTHNTVHTHTYTLVLHMLNQKKKKTFANLEHNETTSLKDVSAFLQPAETG